MRRGLRVFDGKTICREWHLKLSADGKATQATQAFDAFVDKLRPLAVNHPHQLTLLIAELIAEANRLEM